MSDECSEGHPQEVVESQVEEGEVKQEESFVLVKGRKGRRNRGSKFYHDVRSFTSETRDCTEVKSNVLRKINNSTKLLRTSKYYSQFKEKLAAGFSEVSGCGLENLNVFCLGLGPFSSHLMSRISRYQVALLVLLKEEFQASIEVFDPIFTDQEKSILYYDLGFEVTGKNEEGRRVIESPTLLFLPHCPHQLVNNLLYTNWDAKLLSNCYIVCNSLSEAISIAPSKYLEKNLYFLPKAHSICKEIALPNNFSEHPDVFNDIALHVFPATNYVNLTEEFWMDKPYPVYCEQDFISNGIKKK